jgi:RND family efflux transporter MFP subunit
MARRRVLKLVAGLGVAGLLAVVVVIRLEARLQTPPVETPPPLAVETYRVEPNPFRRIRRYGGTIVARRRAVLSSQITAAVLTVPLREGAQVREGDLLVTLDDRELRQECARLEAALAGTDADLHFWREQLQADQRLYRKGMLSERALRETQRRVHTLEAARRETQQALAKANTRLGYTRLLAPFDGVVQAVHALPGELAAAGRSLLELVADAPLKAVLSVPQGDFSKLREGLGVQLRAADESRDWMGQVDRLYPAVDEHTRAGVLEVFLPDPAAGALRPGMSVTADVTVESEDGALAVPEQAVLSRQATGVFVVQGNRAHWRAARAGAIQDGRVRISAGLNAGDRVIITPYPTLVDGRAVVVRDGTGAPR